MNKPNLVKIEGRFEPEALRVLRGIPGLALVSRPGKRGRKSGATLRFAGGRARVAVEFKRRVNAATAWHLIHEAAVLGDTPFILIAGETTAEARKLLQEHGVGVVDGLGNAHIQIPGLLLHREGGGVRRGLRQTPPTRLSGKAGVAAQALLLHPERTWSVKDLAREARISAGLAHRVLVRLDKEGVITTEGSGPNRVRHVKTPAALLDLWAEENVDRLTVTTAHILARTSKQIMEMLGTALEQGGIDYAFTGAAGATLVAPFVTSVPVVEVWVVAKADPQELCDRAGAQRVASGHNIAFLQTKDDTPLSFREKAKGLWLANRFRLYAELRSDPRRGREQADHLRREIIRF